VLLGKRRSFGNLQGRVGNSASLKSLSAWIEQQFDPSATWKDVEWVRTRWPGKLIVKGILHPEDAEMALACGADSLVVSNHGGRQLDGAPASITMLPRIVAAVQGRCEVLLDSGVQCGQDVLKALALGARGCLIGKAFLYALAAGGEAGVTRALEIIRDELKVSLALTGKNCVEDVDSSILR
jgi:L-lactate dehydrogenase (cytochrome)